MASIKNYLGDGVYVTYDGYNIILTTENGISVQDEIFLDPSVVEAFLRYIKDLKNEDSTGNYK